MKGLAGYGRQKTCFSVPLLRWFRFHSNKIAKRVKSLINPISHIYRGIFLLERDVLLPDYWILSCLFCCSGHNYARRESNHCVIIDSFWHFNNRKMVAKDNVDNSFIITIHNRKKTIFKYHARTPYHSKLIKRYNHKQVMSQYLLCLRGWLHEPGWLAGSVERDFRTFSERNQNQLGELHEPIEAANLILVNRSHFVIEHVWISKIVRYNLFIHFNLI